MRIIGRIPHQTMQITVFSNDGRFPVQFELAGQTQIYRFRHSEQLRGLGDIMALVAPEFPTAVLEQFESMRAVQAKVLAAISPQPSASDDLPDIIWVKLILFMQITAAQLAKMINATVEGDPEAGITAPAKIEEAGPGSITFLANPAYEHHLYTTGATAVLVSLDFTPREAVAPTLLRVEDVRRTVGELLAVYQQDEAAQTRRAVSDHAVVDPAAVLGKEVRIGKFTIVEAGAEVGDGTVILDQVYVGPNVTVGKNCTIYPGVRLLRDCVLGDNCILHANVVIGGDGFGFNQDPTTKVYTKIPQVGNVVIEDEVEIGAGTTIDRAVMGSTVIRRGVKLDNLIQIAHNVEIGENTVIAALAGVAGSTKIGGNCQIGGQVGIAGHTVIADGARIQAQSGIASSTAPNATLGGTPAIHFNDYLRSYTIFKQLPEFFRDVRRRLAALEN